MQTVKKLSPHLHSVAQRVFRDEPAALGIVELSFAHAVSYGGLAELDFEREDGVSFNPRPARVALILLSNAQVTDGEVVAAGILASSSPLEALKDLEVSERARVLAHAAHALPDEIAELDLTIRAEVAVVALSLWLDRVRHLHQSPTASERWDAMLALTDRYIHLASQTSAPLHTLLIAWRERAAHGRERQRSLLVEESQ